MARNKLFRREEKGKSWKFKMEKFDTDGERIDLKADHQIINRAAESIRGFIVTTNTAHTDFIVS